MAIGREVHRARRPEVAEGRQAEVLVHEREGSLEEGAEAPAQLAVHAAGDPPLELEERDERTQGVEVIEHRALAPQAVEGLAVGGQAVLELGVEARAAADAALEPAGLVEHVARLGDGGGREARDVVRPAAVEELDERRHAVVEDVGPDAVVVGLGERVAGPHELVGAGQEQQDAGVVERVEVEEAVAVELAVGEVVGGLAEAVGDPAGVAVVARDAPQDAERAHHAEGPLVGQQRPGTALGRVALALARRRVEERAGALGLVEQVGGGAAREEVVAPAAGLDRELRRRGQRQLRLLLHQLEGLASPGQARDVASDRGQTFAPEVERRPDVLDQPSRVVRRQRVGAKGHAPSGKGKAAMPAPVLAHGVGTL